MEVRNELHAGLHGVCFRDESSVAPACSKVATNNRFRCEVALSGAAALSANKVAKMHQALLSRRA